MSKLSIVLAQISTTVGGVSDNLSKIRNALMRLPDGVDLVIFPEMTLSGYPLGDLVGRPDLLKRCRQAARTLATETVDGPAIILGLPWQEQGRGDFLDRVQGDDITPIYNAVLLLQNGTLEWVSSKFHLPNEGIFDEKRQFAQPDHISGPISIAGVRLGVMVCHDMWFADVAETMVETGAEMLVAINASPYEWYKQDKRLQSCINRVVDTRTPLMMVNLVGAEDGVVFDGGSFALDSQYRLVASLPSMQECLWHLEWHKSEDGWQAGNSQPLWQAGFLDYESPQSHPEYDEPMLDEHALVYQAMCIGLKEFVRANGFHKVILGLSGGVDSALVATIAVDGLGAENVCCVMLPSRFTSQQSLDDAESLAERLGVEYHTLPISDLIDAYQQGVTPIIPKGLTGLAAENVQSRIRGSVLMSISNQTGAMLLSTGNKSEIAVGYCTIYGDMCGSFNPIADLYKTELYDICAWRNHAQGFALGDEVIPQAILQRPPSAELADDQRDSDSLPEYAVLDQILYGLIEDNVSINAIVDKGFARETVLRVLTLLDGAQHKRTQAPIGVKLGSCAFKSQWRYPITNRMTKELD